MQIIRAGAALRRPMGTYAMVVEVIRPLSNIDSVWSQSFRDSLSSDDAKFPMRYAHALHSIVQPSVRNTKQTFVLIKYFLLFRNDESAQ